MNRDPETDELVLPPVTPYRAMCNRLVLEAAVRAYDHRHGRTSRRAGARPRKPEPPRQEASAA